jgi:hypothetical protein
MISSLSSERFLEAPPDDGGDRARQPQVKPVVRILPSSGHATRMLAEAKPVCQGLGLANPLITCGQDNIGSRQVIEANGVLERIVDGVARYWLATAPHDG